MKKIIIFTLLLTISCTSTKNTIQNLDPNAVLPKIVNNYFEITTYSKEGKYGYNENYPVNLGFSTYENSNTMNVSRYFEGLTGPKGEKISYKIIETCCPFPSKNNKMGAGTLDLYEVSFQGVSETKKIYINVHERGQIMCPNGFEIRKQP